MVAFWLLLLHPRPFSLPLFHRKVSFILLKKYPFFLFHFPASERGFKSEFFFSRPSLLFSSLGLRYCERPCGGGCLRQNFALFAYGRRRNA